MNSGGISATEEAVNRHLAAAKEKIARLEEQIKNLPSDKGPQLKPAGGPSITKTRGQRQVELEKEINQTKSDTLEKIGHDLEDAPADVRERCDYAVDNWLYPDTQKDGQGKDMEASQAHISKAMYERNHPIPPEKPLEKSDNKTPEQSERFMYRLRYKEDMPEPEQPSEANKEEIKDKDLDAGMAYFDPSTGQEMSHEEEIKIEEKLQEQDHAWREYQHEIQERQKAGIGASQKVPAKILDGEKEKQQPEKTEPQESNKISYGFSFQQRYKEEAPKTEPPTKPSKDLDASQDFAFSLRYRDEPDDPEDQGDGNGGTKSKNRDEIDIDKD